MTNKDARLRRLEARHGLTQIPMLTDRLIQNALDALKTDPDVQVVDGIPMELISRWVKAELTRLERE